MNIGIDFGSTYSLITTFDEREQKLKELTPDGRTAITPSYLSIDEDGEVMFGTFAKSKVHNSRYKHFSGFKMMLIEKNNEILKSNRYNQKYSPQYITELFLKSMLDGILNSESSAGASISIAEGYQKVYICVPELWSKYATKMDGCYNLKKILNEKLGIEDVNIVMEPAAASAYFAYSYKQNTNSNFNGHLFLIDFGGGTLDITLSEVKSNDDTIVVTQLQSDGIGENHRDRNGVIESGQAGMAYIQRLILNVIGKSNIDIASSNFRDTMRDVEEKLTNAEGISKIRDKFAYFTVYNEFRNILQPQFNDISNRKNIFCSFEYNEKKYIITYADLYKAYEEVIARGLEGTVRKMCKYCYNNIGKDPCSIEAGEDENFKIALVGGFGTFYFVQKQIETIFNISNPNDDGRVSGLTVNEHEKAVSYGAALLASGKVHLKKTVLYSVGLQMKERVEENGVACDKRRLYYAIKFNQEISKDDSVSYIERKEGGRARFAAVKEVIKYLVIGRSPDIKRGDPMTMKDEYIEKLSDLPDKGIWNIGFSVDENYIIYLHIVPDKDSNEKARKYELDNYENMFGFQMVEEVFDGEILKDGKL